ncbi:alpha/beta hydrolase family protein (plasmid) [Legionella sp. D16C41]|uniref:alpha/beta hydrolase family protein n=1 Tax=Legionella sp. D16C41 TaxID=3402688 RepID=UPI003AF688C4
MHSKRYLKLTLSLCLLPKLASAVALPPLLEGPYRVGHTSITLQDLSRAPSILIPDEIYNTYSPLVQNEYRNRGRRFVVDMWYPTQATATTPLAEYTFNHTVESDMPPFMPAPTNVVECNNSNPLLGPIAKTLLNTPYASPPPPAGLPPLPQVVCPAQFNINFYSNQAVENVALAPGAFPVIVYSHGSSGQAIEFYKVAERLANNGFIVAALNHANGFINQGVADYLAPNIQSIDFIYNGDIFFTVPPDNIADINFLVASLVARNVSDTNIPSFQNHIDVNQFGAVGFSLGACNTVILAGGSTDLNIAPNPRIKAIMPYEDCANATTEAPASSDENIRSITLPVFTIYGDSSYARNRVFSLLPSQQAPKYEVILKNSTHQLDSGFCGFFDAVFTALGQNPLLVQPLDTIVFGYFANNNFGPGTLLYDCQKTSIPPNYYTLTNTFNSVVVPEWSTNTSYQQSVAFYYGGTIPTWVFDIPPGNFPLYLDEDKVSQFLAFYGTAFFKRYLNNDVSYDNYLKTEFTQKFMPENRMTKCFQGVCEKTNMPS